MKAKGGGILERDAYARLTDAEIDAILAGGDVPKRELNRYELASQQAHRPKKADQSCSICGRHGHYRNRCAT